MYIMLYLDDTFFRCFYNVMYNKYYCFFCSGQQKPKSFLEIQQEQESDFTIKGTAQSAGGSGGGGGVTTPTGNKMKVSPCSAEAVAFNVWCIRVHVHVRYVFMYICKTKSYNFYYIIIGVNLEQCCQGKTIAAASTLVPSTSAADHTHLPEGEGPFIYDR